MEMVAGNGGMGMRPWERFVVIASHACFLPLWFLLASLSLNVGWTGSSHMELPLG